MLYNPWDYTEILLVGMPQSTRKTPLLLRTLLYWILNGIKYFKVEVYDLLILAGNFLNLGRKTRATYIHDTRHLLFYLNPYKYTAQELY